jgi:TetR/AcrR family transcriptional regulator, transcriptional repressor for nem operon
MPRSKAFDEETVLDKAVQLFCSKGYNATSAQDLVDGLEISRSSLYDTFGDKHNLYLEALKQYRRQATGAVVALLDQSTNPAATLRGIFDQILKESLEDPQSKGCFVVNSAVEFSVHDPEITQQVRANLDDMELALCRLLQKGQEMGQFRRHLPPRALARFVLSNISGIRVTAKSGASPDTLQDVVDMAMASLVSDE